MGSSDASSTMTTTAITAVMSYFVSFVLDQATGAIGPAGIALCVAVGGASGFVGYLYGFGRGISAPRVPSPSRRAVNGFTKSKARAILAAAYSDSEIPIDNYRDAVLTSVILDDGVFIASGTRVCGIEGPVEKFTITDQWRAFLKSPRNRKLIEKAAA